MSDLDNPVARFMAAATRRLWWLQSLRRLQIAALVSLLAAAFAAGTHTLLVALPAWPSLSAVLAPFLLAGLAALTARPTARQAAWWADRNLAGASLFSTWQDLLQARDTPASARARLGLRARTAPVLQQSSAQLAAMRVPGQWRLVWLTASCALCCSFVVLSEGRVRAPAIMANIADPAEPMADAEPQAAMARDELRRALQTESRDSAASNGARGAATPPAPPDEEPTGELSDARAARTEAAAAADAARSGGAGAGAGRGRTPMQVAPATPAPQLAEQFRRIGGAGPAGFDGRNDNGGFANSVGGLSGDDRDYDRRQALLARRVAAADAAVRPSSIGLGPSAVELMRRYAARQENRQ